VPEQPPIVPVLVKPGDFVEFDDPDRRRAGDVWKVVALVGGRLPHAVRAVKVFRRRTHTLPTGVQVEDLPLARVTPVTRREVLRLCRIAQPHARADLQAKAEDIKRTLVFGYKARARWKGN
jgi:bifunctional DNA-binding transcriptional regulator/antitoxin component of YhaV-PrlF toxin-antitoxin module